MDKRIVVDTNLLLDDSNVIYKLSREYDTIVIPLTVLKELDDKKYNPNLSYSARNAIQSILQFKEEYPDQITFHTGGDSLSGPDGLIIAAALETGSGLATKDISMSIMANAKGVETEVYGTVLNNIFDPYVHLFHQDLYQDEDVFAFSQMYADEDYEGAFNIFCKASERKLNKDSWFFVIINVEQERPVIYANNPIDHIFDRIDNNEIYLQVNADGNKVKARDPYQNCALYALREAPHCLITGRWGSGKTLLSVAHTLSTSKRKSFITRPPIGLDKKYDLGFLPGKKEDKMIEWLAGFLSALYYLYGNTRGQNKGGVEYDHIRDVMFHELFEVLPMNSIQGLSLLDNDVLMVDEAQLINVDYMSMILSRPSATGKLILMGDLKQTYNVVKPSESGLLKLLRVLPHPQMAYVELQNSYRSNLLEVADLLQDRTIG